MDLKEKTSLVAKLSNGSSRVLGTGHERRKDQSVTGKVVSTERSVKKCTDFINICFDPFYLIFTLEMYRDFRFLLHFDKSTPKTDQ